MAAGVNQPWSDVTLSGATTIDQLRSNLRGLDVVWDSEAEHILMELKEPAERYWATRATLKWN